MNIAPYLITLLCTMTSLAAAQSTISPTPSLPEVPVNPYRLTFRPGTGLHAESLDGAFAVNMWARAQLQYTFLEDPNLPDNPAQSFEVRRASFFMSGNVFGAHNQFFIQLIGSPRDVGLTEGVVHQSPVFDWFFTLDHFRDVSFRFGQYKPFFSRQFIDAWGDLQFVDRSTTEIEFLIDRDIGLNVQSQDLLGLGKFRYYLGVYTGQGRNSYKLSRFHMLYTARLEFLPFGMFDDYRESDLDRNPTPKAAFGASYAFHDDATHDQGSRGNLPKDGGTTDFHYLEADGNFRFLGFSAEATAFWRKGTRQGGQALDALGNPITVTPARNGWGFFVQAGYLLPGTAFEIGARYGQIFGIGSQTSLQDQGELGGVIGYYFGRHAYKLQADYFHLWTTSLTQHGANQLRVQLQMSL